jgi:pyruvate dehydrogenase E2 component (dihydrolipoamide acetyltransferase)
VVREGEVVVRPLLPLTLSADHRLIDGLQASVLASSLIDLLENPEKMDEPAVATA